jgi:proline iminopeptidase
MHLHIERWLVFGGCGDPPSALAYAQAHSSASTRAAGIFLACRPGIDWFMHGMRSVFPGLAGIRGLPEASADLLSYYRRSSCRSAVHLPAPALGSLRGRVLDAPLPASVGQFDSDAAAPIARIEALRARRFADGASLPRIRHLPCQGRYDIVCRRSRMRSHGRKPPTSFPTPATRCASPDLEPRMKSSSFAVSPLGCDSASPSSRCGCSDRRNRA